MLSSSSLILLVTLFHPLVRGSSWNIKLAVLFPPVAISFKNRHNWVLLLSIFSFREAISNSICDTGNQQENENEISNMDLLIYSHSHFENYCFDLKLNDFTLNLLLTIWYLLLTFWNLLFNFEINYSAFKFTVPFYNLQITFWF